MLNFFSLCCCFSIDALHGLEIVATTSSKQPHRSTWCHMQNVVLTHNMLDKMPPPPTHPSMTLHTVVKSLLVCVFRLCLWTMSMDYVYRLAYWLWMLPFCSLQLPWLDRTTWCTSSFVGHWFPLFYSAIFFFSFSFLHIIFPWLRFSFKQAMFLNDAGLRRDPSSQGTFQTWWTFTAFFFSLEFRRQACLNWWNFDNHHCFLL